MAESPRITVLMPVYNGARYLAAAVESILEQSCRDFELLVLDDGSTDGSGALAAAYGDRRIRVLRHESNRGLIVTRNQGLREARGEYVAFLDSDDIALPSRLETQLRFLENNPAYVMVGGRIMLIDEQGRYTGRFARFDASPESIPSVLLFDNCFAHSAVMVRSAVLAEERYRPEFPCAEDYDLFARLALRGKSRIIPEVLTLYREHGGGMSKKRRELLIECTKRIFAWQLNRLGIEPSGEDLLIHGALGCLAADFPPCDPFRAAHWLRKLLLRNEECNLYRRDVFTGLILEKEALACIRGPHPLKDLGRCYFGFAGTTPGAKGMVLAKIIGRNLAKKVFGIRKRLPGADELARR